MSLGNAKAHLESPPSQPSIGAFFSPGQQAPSSFGFGAPQVTAPGVIPLIPFQVTQAVTFTHIAFEVITADSGSATDRASFGIYNSSGKLVASTTPKFWNATGLDDEAIVQGTVTLQPGLYVLAFCSTFTSGPSVSANDGIGLGYSATTSTLSATGTLPATITLSAITLVGGPGNPPLTPIFILH